MSLRGYDAWLERPYRLRYDVGDPPRWAEDFLGTEVFLEDEDAWCPVEGFEEWEDEDEDGKYGDVDLVVKLPSGRTRNLSRTDAEDLPRR